MRRWACLFIPLWLVGCDCSGAPDPIGPRDSGPAPDTGLPPADAGERPDGGVGDTCGDGLDDDRDGEVDEGCQCTPGESQRCYGGDPDLAGEGACTWGSQPCVTDVEFGKWDRCVGWGEPTDDVCDAVDNDCDGEIDPGCDCTPGDEELCYSGSGITEGVGSCVAGRIRCVETDDGSEWTACEGSVLPSEEICDGAGDEDCDERIDEGCDCPLGETQSCYGGAPGTAGVGACAAGTQTCVAGSGTEVEWSACTGETRPTTEVCTGGVDEDCDGLTDCEDPECGASCCTPWNETVPVVPAEGELMFVVDRSGSMDFPATTGRTRWLELTDAMNSVLPMLTDLHMGMLTFPRLTGDAEQLNCMVASSPDVGLALGTGGAISSRLVAADPRAGDTPTPQAFDTTESYLAGISTSRERFVILATDGLPEPNCGSTVAATVAAITDLRTTHGIDTFVIGIVGPDRDGDTSGIPALQAGLNEMAIAGGRARAGSTKYYEASTATALSAALEAIIASATNCTMDLATTPPRPSEVDIRFDGSLVPRSGWTLVGRTLTFSGAYCTQIQSGVVSTITAADTCAP